MPFGLDASGRPGLDFSFVVELTSRFLPNKVEEACPWARPPWKSRLYVDSGLGGLATSWAELLLGVMAREGFVVRPAPPGEELLGKVGWWYV